VFCFLCNTCYNGLFKMNFMDEVWLIVLWSIFGLLHSLLAANKIKDYAISLGMTRNSIRLTYNAISVLSLVPIVLYHINYEGTLLFEPFAYQAFIGYLFGIAAFLILYFAFRKYDLLEFLGFGKWNIENTLNVSGINKVVRHPLYTGTIAGTLGLWFFRPDSAMTISAICIFIYLLIGTYFEERKLILKFGEAYVAYKKSVPRFFPKPGDLYKLIVKD
jgi:protein-S-isoprenylcysteine O-methyltransferase Ste14